jgi:hypothetical protein
VAPSTRIHPVRAAIWNENTTLNLLGETNSDFQADQASEVGDVCGITFDELMRRSSIDYEDILQVDIEGTEKGGSNLPKIG